MRDGVGSLQVRLGRETAHLQFELRAADSGEGGAWLRTEGETTEEHSTFRIVQEQMSSKEILRTVELRLVPDRQEARTLPGTLPGTPHSIGSSGDGR